MAAIVCTLWPVSSLPWAFGLARSNDRLPMYIFVVLNSGQVWAVHQVTDFMPLCVKEIQKGE